MASQDAARPWLFPSPAETYEKNAAVLSGAVVGKRVSVGWKAPVFLCGGGGDFLVGDG